MKDDDSVLPEILVPGTPVRLHHKTALPQSPAWARLLILHGYGEHCGRYLEVMRWMPDRGVACEAIDFRGHGRSSGRRGFIRRWDEYLDDVEAFLAMHSKVGPTAGPLFILGHSHGGLIAIAAGERGILSRAGVAGCVLSSPFLKSRMPTPAFKRILAHAANHLAPWLRVSTGIRGDWLTSDPAKAAEDRGDSLMHKTATPRWYVTMSAMQRRVMADAASFRLPAFVILGDSDIVADPATTAEFYKRAGSADKSLYTYPGRVHELLRETGREGVFADVLGWMRGRAGGGDGETERRRDGETERRRDGGTEGLRDGETESAT
jgi:lysophospholipase